MVQSELVINTLFYLWLYCYQICKYFQTFHYKQRTKLLNWLKWEILLHFSLSLHIRLNFYTICSLSVQTNNKETDPRVQFQHWATRTAHKCVYVCAICTEDSALIKVTWATHSYLNTCQSLLLFSHMARMTSPEPASGITHSDQTTLPELRPLNSNVYVTWSVEPLGLPLAMYYINFALCL